MHMTDALISPVVGATMSVVSGAAVSYSAAKIKNSDLCEKKVPIMGVMGAFVFAAQMINFTIPATGSSGHISGGIMLAAMLGGFPGLLAISAVLIIQCLFFADGGLLALGCNIFNIGVIPCLIIYPLIFKPLVKKAITYRRLTAASIIAVVVGLQLGSLGVVLETQLSGVTQLPFSAFALMMQPIHFAIGLVEGIVTAAVLCFVYKMRPEVIESTLERESVGNRVSMKKIIIAFSVAALLAGGGLSMLASANPDGLEWSLEKLVGTSELKATGTVSEAAASAQKTTAFMPDYDYEEPNESGTGTAVAGIIGGVITFLIAGGSALIISLVKKRQKSVTLPAES